MKRLAMILLACAASATLLRASAQPADPINKIGTHVSAAKRSMSISALPTTPGVIYRLIMPMRFDTFSSDTQFAFALGGRYVTGGTQAFGAQLDLPQGAKLQEVTLFYVDNAAGAIDLTLYESTPDGVSSTPLASADTAGADSPSIRSISLSGAPIALADNAQRTLHIEINLPTATANHRVHGLRVGYSYVTTFLPLLRRE